MKWYEIQMKLGAGDILSILPTSVPPHILIMTRTTIIIVTPPSVTGDSEMDYRSSDRIFDQFRVNATFRPFWKMLTRCHC